MTLKFTTYVPLHSLDCHSQSSEKFLETYRRAHDIPKEKYPLPQTEAQEIGWDITPLVTYNIHYNVMQPQSK